MSGDVVQGAPGTTPGPWKVTQTETVDGQEVTRVISDGHFIAKAHAYNGVRRNAHQIAASPMLYAALEEARKHIAKNIGDYGGILGRIEKALFAAQGKVK